MLDQSQLLLLLKNRQVSEAVALINLEASMMLRPVFEESIGILMADSDFLREAVHYDFVELLDYAVTRGFLTIDFLREMIRQTEDGGSVYTKSLISALEHPRAPRLKFVDRLGPSCIMLYIAMHLSLAHKWPLLHVFAILAFAGLSVLTWQRSGRHAAQINPLNHNRSPLAASRCEKCKLSMRPGSRWRRKQVHCRYCNICIDGFDHHCFWLGCCVNDGNYRMFLASLVSALYMYLLGMLDSAMYYRKRAKIPVQIRVGIAIQFICYVFFFIALLMHVNKKRHSMV